jgi:gamma-glutamyltranspeptidase/glutathione hydrolase
MSIEAMAATSQPLATPVDELLSDAFAKQPYARINIDRIGQHTAVSALPNHRDTLYLTVADRDRNACSFINSISCSWGSRLAAGKTGIVLQNRGSGFTTQEEHPNQLQPRKRPIHTIIPTMVYRQDWPILSFGVMGGRYQATSPTYLLSNSIDYDLDIQEGNDAARFFAQGDELSMKAGVPQRSKQGLSDIGCCAVDAGSPHGGAQAIVIR